MSHPQDAGDHGPDEHLSRLAMPGQNDLPFPAAVDRIEIRISQSGWRWLLDATASAEVWTVGRDARLLGSLPGHYIITLLSNELNRLVLQTYFRDRLEQHGGAPIVDEAASAPSCPPDPTTQAARRAQRRHRAKRLLLVLVYLIGVV